MTRPAERPYFLEGIEYLEILDGDGHYLQLPKLTTAQRNALSATEGMMIYNTDTGRVAVYQDGSWVEIQPWVITGTTLNFFLSNDAADIGSYYYMYPTESGDGYSELTSPSLSTGDDQLLWSFVTEAGEPGVEVLALGAYTATLFLQKSGNKDVRVYWKLFKRDTGGTETEILQSAVSDYLTADNSQYLISAYLNEDQVLDPTDRLVLKLYANVSGTGTDVTVTLTMEGDYDSRLTINVVSSAFNLDRLSDVTISSPSNDELLAYDSGSGKWVNQTPGEAGVLATDGSVPFAGTLDMDGHDIINLDYLRMAYDGTIALENGFGPVFTRDPLNLGHLMIRPGSDNTGMTLSLVPNPTVPEGNPTAMLNLFLTDWSADQENFECLNIKAQDNVYSIVVDKGGTGSYRDIYINQAGYDLLKIRTDKVIEIVAPSYFDADLRINATKEGQKGVLEFYEGSTLKAQITDYGSAYGSEKNNLFEINQVVNAAISLKTNNTERVRIDGDGNVGIGATSPGYTLDVSGDIHCTGKLTSDGGNDPPYVLYNYETRTSIIDRVKKEVLPDKLNGAVLFFNGEQGKLELFLPSKGEFRALDGKVLETVEPITQTCETEDRYYLDENTGEIKSYKVRKPARKYRLKPDHELDPKTGKVKRKIKEKKKDPETGKEIEEEVGEEEVAPGEAIELVKEDGR